MKNLDLNNYGVQEMNNKEMMATEGGWGRGDWGCLFAAAIIILCCI